jgi:alpha,alpha-trehalose phosphorylase
MASELGLKEKAYDYFVKTAYLDLNKTRDTDLGLHSACIGGAWQAIVNGFAGMRLRNGKLDFSPSIPECWESVGFRITFRGRLYHVRVGRNTFGIMLAGESESSDITFRGKTIALVPGRKESFPCR